MKTFRKLSSLQSERVLRAAQLLVGAVAIALVFWKLQFSTSAICCGDFDGYYHVRWSGFLWEAIKHHSLKPTFIWLPLTSLNPRDYVDHHLLFHILQIPFLRSADPRMGAKISSIVFGGLAVMSCYWLLIQYRIRFVLVWLIALLASSAPFLFRMNMTKAPPLAIIFVVVGIHFLFRRKYWPLFPIAVLFTWTYDMFFLLILAAIFWTAVIGWTERRLELRPIIWVLLGTSAGLVINPYFPHNLQLLFEHMRIKLTASDFNTKVGQEWYPYDSWEFLGNSIVACVAMLVGCVAFEPSERTRSHYSLFFLLFSTVLLIMIARWRRIAEYWPPFAVMFAAFSLQPWLEGARSTLTRLPSDVLDELQPFLDRDENLPKDQRDETRDLIRTIAVSAFALVLGTILFVNLRSTVKEIGNSENHTYYRAGAEWLRKNVPAGDRIFNTDWDDFPRLFYYDPSHTYVSGLDPSYLYDQNPDLSQLYDDITLGKEQDSGPLIRDRFGARYVFSDNNHADFFANARSSGWFDIVYEDQQCTIMHIRDTKLQPAEDKGGLPDEPVDSGPP